METGARPAAPEAHLAPTHLGTAGGWPEGRGSQLTQLPGLGFCKVAGQEAGWNPGMASESSLSFFPAPDPNPAEALDFKNKERPRREESSCSVVLEKTLCAKLEASTFHRDNLFVLPGLEGCGAGMVEKPKVWDDPLLANF